MWWDFCDLELKQSQICFSGTWAGCSSPLLGHPHLQPPAPDYPRVIHGVRAGGGSCWGVPLTETGFWPFTNPRSDPAAAAASSSRPGALGAKQAHRRSPMSRRRRRRRKSHVKRWGPSSGSLSSTSDLRLRVDAHDAASAVRAPSPSILDILPEVCALCCCPAERPEAWTISANTTMWHWENLPKKRELLFPLFSQRTTRLKLREGDYFTLCCAGAEQRRSVALTSVAADSELVRSRQHHRQWGELVPPAPSSSKPHKV